MDKQTQALTVIDAETLSALSQVVNTQPKYIPIELIIDLRKKHLSASQIAKIVGCSKPNIVQRLHRACLSLDLTDRYRKNRAEVLGNLQRRISQSITDADLTKAGLRDKVISMGVLYDKERLETGQSTQNIFYADMIKAKSQVDKEIQELEGQNVECSDTKG